MSISDQPTAVAATLPATEAALVADLLRGEEAAFVALLAQYHSTLIRIALIYVNDRAVAEEVVQETWIGVLHGLPRFEGRASLKTWIFRILINRARTRGKREARSIPFSALIDPAADPAEPVVDPARFLDSTARWSQHWVHPPPSWESIPEEQLLSQETRRYVQDAIAALPPSQREILTLRDVAGWSAAEVCQALGITEGNQRVLLHRARAKVRHALAQYLNGP